MTYAMFVKFQNHNEVPYWSYSGMLKEGQEDEVESFKERVKFDVGQTKNKPFKTLGFQVIVLPD